MKTFVGNLSGIVAILATPFDEDDQVDTRAIGANVASSLASGVSAFLVPANAGEVQYLSMQERALVVETVLGAATGRVPVIGCATAPDRAERVRAAKTLMDMGCRAILAHVPYIPGMDEAYAAEVREFAKLAPDLFMLQEADDSGYGAPVPLLVALHRELECFRWIKYEVKGRYRKISELRAHAGPSLSVGTAGQEYLEALDRGVDAYMPTVFHDVYVRIYLLHRAGQRQRARHERHLVKV